MRSGSSRSGLWLVIYLGGRPSLVYSPWALKILGINIGKIATIWKSLGFRHGPNPSSIDQTLVLIGSIDPYPAVWSGLGSRFEGIHCPSGRSLGSISCGSSMYEEVLVTSTDSLGITVPSLTLSIAQLISPRLRSRYKSPTHLTTVPSNQVVQTELIIHPFKRIAILIFYKGGVFLLVKLIQWKKQWEEKVCETVSRKRVWGMAESRG